MLTLNYQSSRCWIPTFDVIDFHVVLVNMTFHEKLRKMDENEYLHRETSFWRIVSETQVRIGQMVLKNIQAPLWVKDAGSQ